jgi:hypothetical protein
MTGSGANKVVYSDDGITWTASGSGNTLFTSGAYGIKYDGNMWVAGGYVTGGVGYSYDGITWLAGTATPATTVFVDFAYNGYIWVGMSPLLSSSVYYSYNGINWLLSSSGTNLIKEGSSVAWNGTIWVCGGRQNSGSGSFLAYSYDGINWTAATINSSYTLGYMDKGQCISWNGLIWIAAFISGGALQSYDGINWTSATNIISLTTDQVYGVASRSFTLRSPNAISTKQSLSGNGTSSTGGTLVVTFTSKIFATATPIVTATVTGTTAGYVTVSSITANGFTATAFNSAGTGTSGITFNWTATNP